MGQPDVYSTNLAVYRRRHTIKSGPLTLATQVDGQIPWANRAGLGLYYRDTRFLSGWELWLNGEPPLSLFSTSRQNNVAQIDLTNPPFRRLRGRHIPMHTIHLRVGRVIRGDLYQRLRVVNFNPFPIALTLRMEFAADFADVFEVRGMQRTRRGRYRPLRTTARSLELAYDGRDGVRRRTQILFKPGPQAIRRLGRRCCATFTLRLPPKRRRYLYLRIRPTVGPERRAASTYERVLAQARTAARRWQKGVTEVVVDNDLYQQMLWRAQDDVRTLTTAFPGGTAPAAGLPWFDCPFGRDSLITARQMLWVWPELAVSVVRFLAAYQGRRDDPWRDEEPGKIMHELRLGEMAQAGELPHTPYYGSVDATLLFVALLGELDAWVQDLRLLRACERPFRAALRWIETYGDADGDGFVEYRCRSPKGLVHQGWKDSEDGVLDEHGRQVTPPIALVEVQGNLYEAYRSAAAVLSRLGDAGAADRCRRAAQRLRRRFLAQFWSPERRTLAYGLDGKKRPFFAAVSNVGQVLASGLVPAPMAHTIIRRLFQPDLYSGWGIRTRSSTERPYNPMSYHNGSVWPHDNALIAEGLRHYGALAQLDRLVTGFFDAAVRLEYYRLPELFCGFVRRGEEAPVIFPAACVPQAWAAGSFFQFTLALLGLRMEQSRLVVDRPVFPYWINSLRINRLRIGKGFVDLAFERKADGQVRCRLVRSRGPVHAIVRP